MTLIEEFELLGKLFCKPENKEYRWSIMFRMAELSSKIMKGLK